MDWCSLSKNLTIDTDLFLEALILHFYKLKQNKILRRINVTQLGAEKLAVAFLLV